MLDRDEIEARVDAAERRIATDDAGAAIVDRDARVRAARIAFLEHTIAYARALGLVDALERKLGDLIDDYFAAQASEEVLAVAFVRRARALARVESEGR